MNEFETIYAYSRKQALEDGVLIDVTQEAQEVGFKIPVAVTSRLYHEYICPQKGLEGYGQSVAGRLHDVLWLAVITARSHPGASHLGYDVLFQMLPGEDPETVQLTAHIGPGDQGEPVLAIMLPGDD